MAKRFTDTDKYKKKFIRGLQGAYKLLWDYLYHDCDHAGIWYVDFEIAQIYLGKDMPVSEADALKYFNDSEERIVVLADGKKWFIPSFVEFQYGVLNADNRAHASVISVLTKAGVNKGLLRSLQGRKDKDMDKDMDKKGESEGKPKKDYIFVLPEWIPEQNWKAFVEMRTRIKKPLTEWAKHLIELELQKIKKAGHDPIAAMDKSTRNSWQDVYMPRDNGKPEERSIADQYERL